MANLPTFTPKKDIYKGMTPNTMQKRPNSPMTSKQPKKIIPNKGSRGK